MTIQEIREMLDSTITANGKREISGQSLNTALNAILDYVSENGSGLKGGSITVLIPNSDTFDVDNTDETLLENNKACFEALKNQTEPMLVFMRYLGAEKPFAQTALRMRHLHEIGEGVDFFAFGYPAPYTNKERFGLLAYSDEMYKLTSDGKIERIDLLGQPYGSHIAWPVELTEDAVIGVYGHSDESTPSMLGQTYLPEIVKEDGVLMMKYPFGSSIENTECKTPVTLDIENKTLTIEGGYTHPSFGPISNAVTLSIDTSDSPIMMVAQDNVITLNDWASVTNYTMVKKS